MEYLSDYDNFLKLHFQKYSSKELGNDNYLSHNICDEFISLISKHTEFIVEEIRSLIKIKNLQSGIGFYSWYCVHSSTDNYYKICIAKWGYKRNISRLYFNWGLNK